MSMRENNSATVSRPLGVTAIAVVSILFGCLALPPFVIYLTGQWQADLAYPSAGIRKIITLGLLCFVPLICGGGLLCMQEWARRGARIGIAAFSMFEPACVLWFIYFGSLQDAIALMTAYWGLSIFIAALFIFQLWAWFYLGRREVVARFMLTEGDNMPETADEFLERKIEMKSENYRVQDLQSGKGGL